jgi:hypothetical protein
VLRRLFGHAARDCYRQAAHRRESLKSIAGRPKREYFAVLRHMIDLLTGDGSGLNRYVLVSRRGGELRHSRIQAVVASRLNSKEQQWGMILLIAPRVQVSLTRVRIPDLALVDDLDETRPPVLAIEIVSPEDKFSEIARRCSEFLRAGVRAVWLIDPDSRIGHVCTDRLRRNGRSLRCPALQSSSIW